MKKPWNIFIAKTENIIKLFCISINKKKKRSHLDSGLMLLLTQNLYYLICSFIIMELQPIKRNRKETKSFQ